VGEEEEKSIKEVLDDFSKFSNKPSKKYFTETARTIAMTLVFGAVILYLAFMWQGMTMRFAEMCENFCTACDYPGFQATAMGSCTCYGEQQLGWYDINAPNGFYTQNKSVKGCPNANATRGMKVIG